MKMGGLIERGADLNFEALEGALEGSLIERRLNRAVTVIKLISYEGWEPCFSRVVFELRILNWFRSHLAT